MNTASATLDSAATRHPALRAPVLRLAAQAWFAVMALGQLLFATYVVGVYVVSLLQGEPERWNRVQPRFFNAGDTLGNTLMAVHVLMAVVLLAGGVLQLLPAVRRRWPALHRWTGRVYLVAALWACTAGLVLLWVRGTVGDLPQHLAITGNALIIVGCGWMAWRHARAGRFDRHREWALRLVLAVSGVFFFRVGLMAWLMIHRAPAGFDPKTFSGPFLTALAIGVYLVLPLLVLELYLRAGRAGRGAQWAVASLLGVLTLLTLLGTAGAAGLMWLPHLR